MRFVWVILGWPSCTFRNFAVRNKRVAFSYHFVFIMRLFADKVMPVLQHDARFAKPPPELKTMANTAQENMFAPA